ncbi:ATP-binding protein [Neoroseomonas lacus]|uniref:YhaN AAA domain-containing protein n=1 Tax=Neoroseomonas lacus TaxID=287609 RepID=A0A917NY24_9PROT|nr:YhaN family protein [Neoroseomonas lacus]GGJ40435.1 hypothetical protein GCM10011320_55100 [Neoroseomonas lacus]
MRFSKLHLEKYGRFENCELEFPARAADIHIISGGNEAGKSTSRSGVSDLLFGFPVRSPYNFRFDYPMLRIGAVVEEGGRVLAFRRRKAASNSLVDAADNPIAESDLLAMLRGQTRETFQLSFSLDQEALRNGGRAMVSARDNVGQALFAAGSGMVRVSDELKRLQDEAEAIWGPRAKQSRTYTRAERELEVALRAIRDGSLRPKAWKDARDALDAAKEHLDAIEKQRSQLIGERQLTDRTRRVAGNVQLRESLLRQLSEAADVVELAPAIEAAVLSSMEAANAASRAKAAAERLLVEINDRRGQQVPDPAVLAEVEAIEDLVAASGAVAKGLKDVVDLRDNRDAVSRKLDALQADAGTASGTILSAETVEGLRKLSAAHAADVAALQQIRSQQEELELRRDRLEAKLAAETDDGDPSALIIAVDAARKLGADVDDRCSALRRAVARAGTTLKTALARLSLWTGDADGLARLGVPSSEEIERAKLAWDREREAIAADDKTARRLDGEVAQLTLQIEAVGTGAGISHQQLLDSRSDRTAKWRPIRAHLCDEGALDDPAAQAAMFEGAVTSADDLADHRFALAEASARLVGLEADRAQRAKAAEQARSDKMAAAERLAVLQDAWQTRLQAIGLPDLDPVQIGTFLELRTAALGAKDDLDTAEAEADHIESRRATAIAALVHAMGEVGSPDVSEIASPLARAERARSAVEARSAQRKANRESLAQIGDDLAALGRRQETIRAKAALRSQAWDTLLTGTDLMLDIATAGARLSAFDAVRQAKEVLSGLNERIDGITQDAERFHEDVAAVSERLEADTAPDDAELVKRLRARLEKANATARVLAEQDKDRAARQKEIDEASAKHAAATEALLPVMEQVACDDPLKLPEVIARSSARREKRENLARVEEAILRDGDGKPLYDLVALVMAADLDSLTVRSEEIERQINDLNTQASNAAAANGEANRAFADLERATTAAPDAAFDAEQARAEMATQAEAYILKRTQALTLRWAIERYRERHQNPLVTRASKIFSTLTLARYSGLRVDLDEASPRLLGISEDGRNAVEVDAMSEGTTDQLFLSLRLAAIEQTVDAGIRLPFIADDLFVNFDDDRARAGFQVLADLARKTQVLFFTHHAHLADIAKSVLGDEAYSECRLS